MEIENVTEIRGLVEVYEELAASKMQKIRHSVVNAQEYYEGLANISEEVSLDLFENSNTKAKGEAAILLSAEAGLYGDMVDKLIVSFVDFVNKNKSDAFIAGKAGVNLIKVYDPSFKYQVLDIPMDDEVANGENLKSVLKMLTEYKKISVFHGRFQSLVVQSAVSSSVSGGNLGELGKIIDKDEAIKIRLRNLYEPTIAQVGSKFSDEISLAIFFQSFAENQLAKYAARLIHLDGALENINQKIGVYHDEERKMRKKSEQKKQTERVSRMIALRQNI